MKVEIERDVSHLQKEMLQEQRRIKLRRLFRNRLSMLEFVARFAATGQSQLFIYCS